MPKPAGSTVNLSELDQRAARLVARLPQLRTTGVPYVGIPLLPGAPPFVTRRKWLERQTQGVSDLRFHFHFTGDRAGLQEDSNLTPQCTRLTIEGRFGANGGDGRRGNRHHCTLVNQLERGSIPGATVPGMRGLQELMRNWAEKRRADPLRYVKALRRKLSSEDLVGKRQARIEIKIARLDAEIGKLQRRISDVLRRRPVNPLIGRDGGADAGDRESAARYYAEKPRRRLLSQLAAKYATRAKVTHRRGLTVTVYPWAEFYAELAAHGITPATGTLYSKVHPLKGGPACLNSYLHNPIWFGLLAAKGDGRRGAHSVCRRMEGGGMRKPAPEDDAEAMAEHIKARAEYAGALQLKATIESMIERLRAERQGYVEALAEVVARERNGGPEDD